MRADDHSVRQIVDDLSSAALRDLLRNVRHHTELRRQIASGLIDERTVNDAYREYARREGSAYRQQVADLTVQYYSDLAELGNSYSESFYADVLDGIDTRTNGQHPNGSGRNDDRRGSSGTGSAPPRDSRTNDATSADIEEVPVELHAPPGREVIASFALENTESQPAALSIEVGPCQGPGDESFMAPLTVQPAQFIVDPGARRSITLRLMMLPTVFVPGHLYRLRVRIIGPTELVLLVTIWAEEPDSPTASPTEPAKRPPTKKRAAKKAATKKQAAAKKKSVKRTAATKKSASTAKPKTSANKAAANKKSPTTKRTAKKAATNQSRGRRTRDSGTP